MKSGQQKQNSNIYQDIITFDFIFEGIQQFQPQTIELCKDIVNLLQQEPINTKKLFYSQNLFEIFHMIPSLRPLCWRLILNYLPENKKLWVNILENNNKKYQRLLNDHIQKLPQLNKNFNKQDINNNNNQQNRGKSKTSYLKDHPLSKKKDSQWNTYFEDKKLLDKILKDTLRTRTNEDFFTQKVGQYKEIKQQQQENLHETGQLKQQKNNQEDEQDIKANNTNGQKKRSFFSRFIKPKLPGKINQDNGQSDDFNSSLKNQNQQNKEEIKISIKQDNNNNNHINNNIQNGNKDFYHYEVITRILFIYAKLNPQVDYTQGMNEICAIIYHCFYHDASDLFRQYAESDTFFCFCIFMTQIKDNFKQEDDDFWIQQEQLLKSENVVKHQKFMNQNIRQNILIFEEQFKKCDYILYNHMEQEKVDSKLYVVKWIMVLLGQEFHIEEILRLWDSIMIAPEKITFTIYLCLAVLYIQRDELLQSDFSQIIQKLQDISSLNIDKILEFAIKLYRQYNCQNDIFKYVQFNGEIGTNIRNIQKLKQ